MAITQAMATSFKVALLDGEMDFSSNTNDVFKIALYTNSATLNATTTAYQPEYPSSRHKVDGAQPVKPDIATYTTLIHAGSPSSLASELD